MTNSYLLKHGMVYYARFRVPDNLVQFIGKKEVRWSLKTGCQKEARQRVFRHRQIFLDAVKMASDMKAYEFNLSPEEMKSIQACINDYMDEQLRLFRGYTTGNDADHKQAEKILAEKACEMDAYNKAITSEDFSKVNGELSKFLEFGPMKRLAIMFDQPNPNYQWFAEIACKTELEIFKKQQGLLKPNVTSQQNQSTPTHSRKLSEVVEQYLKEKKNKGLGPKSLQEYETCFSRLIQFLDDPDIYTIERRHMSDFFEAIQNYPVKVAEKDKAKGFKELVANNKAKSIGPTTINKHMSRPSELFNWLIDTDSSFNFNPAKRFNIKDDRKQNEERKAFTDDQIKMIFEKITIFQGKKKCSKTAHYWSPIIGVYSGMRIEEICQLDVKDIIEKDGVYCFDINDNDEKKLKNKQSRRIIPIHTKILNLGFIEYFQFIKNLGHKKLFPTLNRCKTNGYSHNPGKWFSRNKKSLGLEETTEVFHSFRHAVSNSLKQQEVGNDIITEIIGHESENKNQSALRYSNSYNIPILKEAIEKLNFPINVIPYKDIKLVDSEKRALKLVEK